MVEPIKICEKGALKGELGAYYLLRNHLDGVIIFTVIIQANRVGVSSGTKRKPARNDGKE